VDANDIERAIADRFGRWGRFLREQGASPLVVLGLRADDETIVVCTVEEMPDGLIMDSLVAAARLIAEGRVDGR
jgi:hypothetical protein